MKEKALLAHEKWNGKLETIAKSKVHSRKDLSIAYTPGVAEPCKEIAAGFGGINLEDISAPRCFEIEERLKEILDIPVFHDAQHGTAIVVLTGVINGLRITGKKKEDCIVVVNGAGSAGVAITKLLLRYGFTNVIMCDKEGIIGKDRHF